MTHSFPNFVKTGEIKQAHDTRILGSCVGPSGDLLLTAAGDENLKFWRIWDAVKHEKKKIRSATSFGTREGFMAIR